VYLRWEEGQRSLDQQAHQPLGVEDELVAARFLVPTCGDCVCVWGGERGGEMGGERG